jgi:large subunit ribosomal protein L15
LAREALSGHSSNSRYGSESYTSYKGRGTSVKLGFLHPSPESVRPRKRVGRGPGSGHGSTSGRGSKGLFSRAGGKKKVPSWFEGGQMPLQRRLPKRGFRCQSRRDYQVVNLGDLNRCAGAKTITAQVLADHGLIHHPFLPVKILGNGVLTHVVEIQAQAFSSSAIKKIQQAGSKVIIQG